MKILKLGRDSLLIPLFATIWRSILGDCDFGVHLAGATGVFKSELAALIQQHYGPSLDARHLPGSWQSTDNALEGLLFSGKDMVVVVDDFAPCGSSIEVSRWHKRADRVFRGQGNHSGRGRMKADGTLRPVKPPRGLVLSTGEDIPRGQSLRARVLILEVGQGDISTDVLTDCQKLAREGVFASALAGYIHYLAPLYAQIRVGLRKEVEAFRGSALDGNAHCRTPELLANLFLGLHYFLCYAESTGAVSHDEVEPLKKRWWAALKDAGRKQAAYQASQEPAQRFIELLTSAIGSGHAHLANRNGRWPKNKPEAWGWREPGGASRGEWLSQGTRVGWIDGDDIFLDLDAAFKVAQSMTSGTGDGLTVSAPTLRRRLAEKDMLVRTAKRDELSVRRTLEGRERKVIHLARGILCAKPAEPAEPA